MKIALLSLFSCLLCYYCIYISFKFSVTSAKCLDESTLIVASIKNQSQIEDMESKHSLLQLERCNFWQWMTCYGPRPKYLDFSTVKFSAIPQYIGNYMSFTVFQSLKASFIPSAILQTFRCLIFPLIRFMEQYRHVYW